MIRDPNERYPEISISDIVPLYEIEIGSETRTWQIDLKMYQEFLNSGGRDLLAHYRALDILRPRGSEHHYIDQEEREDSDYESDE